MRDEERRCLECQDSTHHGTQAGLAGVSEEAEAAVDAGLAGAEALEEVGSAGAQGTAEGGVGERMAQACLDGTGVPVMLLCTGKITGEERRCRTCQD